MKRSASLVVVGLLTLALSACVVKQYPRTVTAKEKMDTNFAFDFDTIGALMVAGSNAGPGYDLDRQKVHIDYQYYLDPRLRQDPRQFYPRPPGPPAVTVVETLKDTADTEVLFIKWYSQYQPQNPAFAPAYAGYPETHTAYGVYVRSKKGNRGAIASSHGWTGGDVRKAYEVEKPLEMVKLGYDIVLIQQPYHGLRAPAGSKFSGEYFFSGELARTNEAFCQTVTDVRGMVAWLRQDHQVVGIKGGSLGGITTLLTAAVEPEVDFAIAWVPPSSLADIPDDTPLAPFIIKGLRASGIDQRAAADITYVSSVPNFTPAIPKADILIFAGMGDNFVPPPLPTKIWTAWGEPQIFWYAGGHVLNFEKKRCLQIQADFLLAHLNK
jgi:dienelactone hydrolase